MKATRALKSITCEALLKDFRYVCALRHAVKHTRLSCTYPRLIRLKLCPLLQNLLLLSNAWAFLALHCFHLSFHRFFIHFATTTFLLLWLCALCSACLVFHFFLRSTHLGTAANSRIQLAVISCSLRASAFTYCASLFHPPFCCCCFFFHFLRFRFTTVLVDWWKWNLAKLCHQAL